MNNKNGLLPALLISIITQSAVADEHSAQQARAEKINSDELPSVEVEESVHKAETFSGSTSVIDKETLERDQVFTVN